MRVLELKVMKDKRVCYLNIDVSEIKEFGFRQVGETTVMVSINGHEYLAHIGDYTIMQLTWIKNNLEFKQSNSMP